MSMEISESPSRIEFRSRIWDTKERMLIRVPGDEAEKVNPGWIYQVILVPLMPDPLPKKVPK